MCAYCVCAYVCDRMRACKCHPADVCVRGLVCAKWPFFVYPSLCALCVSVSLCVGSGTPSTSFKTNISDTTKGSAFIQRVIQ